MAPSIAPSICPSLTPSSSTSPKSSSEQSRSRSSSSVTAVQTPTMQRPAPPGRSNSLADLSVAHDPRDAYADEPNWPSGWRPYTTLLGGFLLMFNSWGLVRGIALQVGDAQLTVDFAGQRLRHLRIVLHATSSPKQADVCCSLNTNTQGAY